MKPAIRSLVFPRRVLIAAAGYCAFGWAVCGRADNPIPTAFPPDRYARMAAHSPFTPPTAPVQAAPTAPPPPKTSFADKLTATNMTEVNSVYEVTVVDPDSTRHIYVRSDGEDPETHLRIASVKWPQINRDEPGARETPIITITKGTESAQLRYEPGGGGGGAGMSGAMPMNGAGAQPRPFIPGNAGVRPPGAPAIPGNTTGNVAVAPPPGVPPGGPRRAMPIRAFPPASAPAAQNPVLPGGNATTQPLRRGVVTKPDDDDDDD